MGEFANAPAAGIASKPTSDANLRLARLDPTESRHVPRVLRQDGERRPRATVIGDGDRGPARLPRKAVGLVGFLLALWLRLAIGDVLVGYPFITFFPVIILTTFLGGALPGAAAAVLCGIASWYFFIEPCSSFALDWPGAVALGFYGTGLPEDYDPARSTSLGLKVIRGLAAQLGGDVAITSGEGTTTRVVFAA